MYYCIAIVTIYKVDVVNYSILFSRLRPYWVFLDEEKRRSELADEEDDDKTVPYSVNSPVSEYEDEPDANFQDYYSGSSVPDYDARLEQFFENYE